MILKKIKFKSRAIAVRKDFYFFLFGGGGLCPIGNKLFDCKKKLLKSLRPRFNRFFYEKRRVLLLVLFIYLFISDKSLQNEGRQFYSRIQVQVVMA